MCSCALHLLCCEPSVQHSPTNFTATSNSAPAVQTDIIAAISATNRSTITARHEPHFLLEMFLQLMLETTSLTEHHQYFGKRKLAYCFIDTNANDCQILRRNISGVSKPSPSSHRLSWLSPVAVSPTPPAPGKISTWVGPQVLKKTCDIRTTC